MLFDLTGKRRRVIQVIYACLAMLMGGSLVLFGIGSDAPGGILDGLGIGSGSGSTSPQYQQQLDEAEDRLEADPGNSEALLEIARVRYLMGQEGIVADPETGATQLSSEGRENLELAFDSWERYLGTDPQPPDTGMATNLSRAGEILFSDALGRGDVRNALATAEQTAETARVGVRQEPTAPVLASMARYLYIAGNNAQADRARERAVALVDREDRDDIEETLDEQAKEAKRLHRQLSEILETGDAGTGAIEDPFGGLGQPAPQP